MTSLVMGDSNSVNAGVAGPKPSANMHCEGQHRLGDINTVDEKLPLNANHLEESSSSSVLRLPSNACTPRAAEKDTLLTQRTNNSTPSSSAILLSANPKMAAHVIRGKGAAVPMAPCERRVIFPTYRASTSNRSNNLSTSSVGGGGGPQILNYGSLKSPSRNSIQQRPKPKEIGVNHEYRNHLIPFFAPEKSTVISSSNNTTISAATAPSSSGTNARRPSVDDICIGSMSRPITAKRSSILPKLPLLGATIRAHYDEATVESGGTCSTASTTSTTSTNRENLLACEPQVVPTASSSSLKPSAAKVLPSVKEAQPNATPVQPLTPQEAATPKGYRRIVPASPHNSIPIIPKAQLDALARSPLPPPKPPPSTSTAPASSRSPRRLKSILRQKPKYPPHPTCVDARLQKAAKPSSVPSLVDINTEECEADEDDASHDSCDRDGSSIYQDPEAVSSDAIFPSESISSPLTSDSMEFTSAQDASMDKADSPEGCTPEDEKVTKLQDKKLMFDPRVWVREFYREPIEADCTWYTSEDMESFKRLALDRILRYQSSTEIMATGTARVMHRARRPWSGPVYSHAALTLDGENDNDSYLRKKVLEKELQSVLIVDPHDLSLKLFKRALQTALPRSARVTTTTSSEEVLKLLERGQRFDLIIVEERLQLFHRHHSSSSTSSSTSATADKGSTFADRTARFGLSSTKSSGAALIEMLSKSPVTSKSLFIGVSSHMKEDEAKLLRCGSDFNWEKPPPPINQDLIENLAKTVLVKRGRDVLAAELFG